MIGIPNIQKIVGFERESGQMALSFWSGKTESCWATFDGPRSLSMDAVYVAPYNKDDRPEGAFQVIYLSDGGK